MRYAVKLDGHLIKTFDGYLDAVAWVETSGEVDRSEYKDLEIIDEGALNGKDEHKL